jgi:hypothetical protein
MLFNAPSTPHGQAFLRSLDAGLNVRKSEILMPPSLGGANGYYKMWTNY